ncbi:MAG: hypothetical protein AB8B91_13600 [Rubripirellula sp.]
MSRGPFLLALLCLPFIVGCEGCRRDPGPEDEANNEQQAPLEDFSSRPPLAFPAGIDVRSKGIKPGHWLTASQPIKSNKIDARGELHSRSSAKGANFRSGEEQTFQGEVRSVRPVVLPKGQLRRFDFRMLAPVPANTDRKTSLLNSRFVSSGRTVYYDIGSDPFKSLLNEEYFFVILTTRPERFARFQVANWVRPEYEYQDSAANYRIVLPPVDDLLPLSETMLDWTSTAVVLWDDLSPDALTPQQQVAMADWLRFGGHLIVNGASGTDSIAKTALADVLPLKPTSNIELDPASGSELLRGWAVKSDASTEKQIALLQSQSGRVAVDGQITDDAVALPDSGKLVLTRRVGNGRVVQPRFDLTSDWLVNWSSFDSFVNSAILSRPRRQFIEDLNDGSYSPIDYSDTGTSQMPLNPYRQFYPDWKSSLSDPAMNTHFRISARDAILRVNDEENGSSAIASRIDPLAYADSVSGIGGWTDSSDTVSLCRQILRNESGIEIPDSSLVIRSLGYYLLILVPINYLIFRLMGRLEYAWLAVPVIAFGGAIWVARAARLDIGFARSQTELALIELQPDYHRAHLTRVIAVYNSLSSTYDIEFKTIDGAAMPIWTGNNEPTGETIFKTGFSEGPVLEGLAVGSNQIRMLHTEQVVDVGGPISLNAEGQLVNQTQHELFDAFVIEKSDKGAVRVAMVGGCQSGAAVKLRFQNATVTIGEELPMQAARMIRRFASPSAMANGSTRLVGRIDGSVPGITITPDANQTIAQTIVLAHLKHAPIPEPQVDMNLVRDLRKVLSDNEIENDESTPGKKQL